MKRDIKKAEETWRDTIAQKTLLRGQSELRSASGREAVPKGLEPLAESLTSMFKSSVAVFRWHHQFSTAIVVFLGLQ